MSRLGPRQPCDPEDRSSVLGEIAARKQYLRDIQWILETATEALSHFDRDLRVASLSVQLEAIQDYLRRQGAKEQSTFVWFVIMSAFTAGFGLVVPPVVAPVVAEILAASGFFLQATIRRHLTTNTGRLTTYSGYRQMVSGYLNRTVVGAIVEEVGRDVAGRVLSASISDRPYSEDRVVVIDSVQVLAYTLSSETAHLSHQIADVEDEWDRMIEEGKWNALCDSVTAADSAIRATLQATRQWGASSSASTDAMLDRYGYNFEGMIHTEKAKKALQVARHWALVIASVSYDPSSFITKVDRGAYKRKLHHAHTARPQEEDAEVVGWGYTLDGVDVPDHLTLDPMARALARVLYEPPAYSQTFAERAAERAIGVHDPGWPLHSLIWSGSSEAEKDTWRASYREQVAVKQMSRIMFQYRLADMLAGVAAYVARIVASVAGMKRQQSGDR